jgi:hypothetical protein
MSKNSWKHHYIPKFYLRNFTNSKGKFHIYLVNNDKFKEKGKLFSPDSHFFVQDGNTINLGEDSTDLLETHSYKQLDSDASKLFHKIKFSTEPGYGLSEKDMPALQYFIAHMFWRNPINDEFVKTLIREKGLEYLGIHIIDAKTNKPITNSDFIKSMEENGSAYKLAKNWIPSALFNDLIKSKKPLTILNFEVGHKPSLIGDNPLILKNPENYDVYTDDVILPLCSGKYLIRTEKLKPEYNSTLQISIDRLIFRQAKNFVATTKIEYLIMLRDSVPELSVDELRINIFNELTD